MISNFINECTMLKKYSDRNRLHKEAVAYIGQPKQSPSEPAKIFLQLESSSTLLEFKAEDIIFVENLETVAGQTGETFQIFKIWIRVGSVGVKLDHFTV